MRFEFVTASRILFGEGTSRELGTLVEPFGTRALVAVFRSTARIQPLLDSLSAAGINVTLFTVEGEPTVEMVVAGADAARSAAAQVVVSIGGGSVMDAGKAIAALSTNLGDPYDYMEVIGKGKPLTVAPLPFIAVPTTAGTGSEVTRNAVVASHDHQVKVSIRHPLMLAKIAVIDPELTYNLPPEVTATTGMDALTQCIEPYTSNAANPITDALSSDGIRHAARSLRRAYDNGQDKAARADMAYASLLGGLSLANAKLGAVHGFAGPIGGMFNAPHGAVCAVLLPHVMAANVHALESRAPDSGYVQRYQQVAQWLTGDPQASAVDGVAFVRGLGEALCIPPLSTYGITSADFPKIVEQSAKASSMKGNCITLTSAELTAILAAAL
ncbi:MAG: iron-containing alcohol dehydrogenase [Anaerolineae bacterium]